jgi:hypothetical protein
MGVLQRLELLRGDKNAIAVVNKLLDNLVSGEITDLTELTRRYIEGVIKDEERRVQGEEVDRSRAEIHKAEKRAFLTSFFVSVFGKAGSSGHGLENTPIPISSDEFEKLRSFGLLIYPDEQRCRVFGKTPDNFTQVLWLTPLLDKNHRYQGSLIKLKIAVNSENKLCGYEFSGCDKNI